MHTYVRDQAPRALHRIDSPTTPMTRRVSALDAETVRIRLDGPTVVLPTVRALSQRSADGEPLKVVALIPAHNEADSIAATIEALLVQHRRLDQIVVIPNGCLDDTAEIARRYPITVLELPRLEHKKSEALNTAWERYCRGTADIVICLDADTVLPPNAIGDWEAEFVADSSLAGSSSKFTMIQHDGPGALLTRLQRAEFARWTDSSLRRGSTSVLAGTGCGIRNSVLERIADMPGRAGPWSYSSLTEDFELTYQIRAVGFRCQVSPKVRAYTDSMKSVRALWAQRMKWQVGTVSDLMQFGFNRYTAFDWWQQAAGFGSMLVRLIWITLTMTGIILGTLQVHWLWFLVPVLFILTDVRHSMRIPMRTKKDVLVAAALLPQEFFAWMRAGWFIKSWVEVLVGRVTRKTKDRWTMQYAAESKNAEKVAA